MDQTRSMLKTAAAPGLTRRAMLGSAAALASAPLVGLGSWEARAAAPLMGLKKQSWERFKLGAFELTMISDSDAFIDGPYPIIGANASAAEVEKLMRDNMLPPKTYQPGFTPMLVNTGKEIVLFDTGNGTSGFIKRPQGGWLAQQLGPAGFKPEDIDVVVLSHGHIDHVAGVMEGDKPLFPNARYVIAGIEYDFWAPEGKHSGDMEKFAAVFRANVLPVAERTKFLKPGDDVVPGIRSLEASGHTPGHLAFTLESNGAAHAVLGRLRASSRRVAVAPRLALRVRCRQGAGRSDAQAHLRHGGDRTRAGERLSHAVPVHRLRREAHRRRLSLDPTHLPAHRALRNDR